MNKYLSLLFISALLVSCSGNAQEDYEKGFEDGYERAYGKDGCGDRSSYPSVENRLKDADYKKGYEEGESERKLN